MSHVLIYPVRHSYSDSMARKMGLLTAHGVKAHSDHAAISSSSPASGQNSSQGAKSLDRAVGSGIGVAISDSDFRLAWLEIERWEDDGGH